MIFLWSGQTPFACIAVARRVLALALSDSDAPKGLCENEVLPCSSLSLSPSPCAEIKLDGKEAGASELEGGQEN